MRHLPDAIDALIVAPATAGGSGARAIVRMAGDGLAQLLAALFTTPSGRGFAAVGTSEVHLIPTSSDLGQLRAVAELVADLELGAPQ
jgi:hypothetical protein